MVLSVDSSYSHDMMEVDNESSLSSINSENILTPGERLQWLNREAQMIDRLIDFAITIAQSLFYFETLGLDLLYSGGNERDKFAKKLELLLTLWENRSNSGDFHRDQMVKEIADIAFSNEIDLLNIEIKKSDPASYIRITVGFKILTATGIFPELFTHMPSHVVRNDNDTLQGYTVLY
ncbi:5373_t:CDS:2 [Gigaspora margarita]|uniref:5373_t:CDS:1 n=1 Tax=Gigaspora margarita TaxID=4874 RepID=A0ABN7VBA7_GIGMA|nr:5373_t:CDS:2 [Gigaspora margarita]